MSSTNTSNNEWSLKVVYVKCVFVSGQSRGIIIGVPGWLPEHLRRIRRSIFYFLYFLNGTKTRGVPGGLPEQLIIINTGTMYVMQRCFVIITSGILIFNFVLLLIN